MIGADDPDRVAPLAEAQPQRALGIASQRPVRDVARPLGRERLGASLLGCSFLRDPRVEDAVEEVDEQVGEDEDERDQQRRRLDDRVVAAEDRLQQRVADPGQPEDDLDDRGAADQDPISKPTIVTTGIRAFRSACFEIDGLPARRPWRARCGRSPARAPRASSRAPSASRSPA